MVRHLPARLNCRLHHTAGLSGLAPSRNALIEALVNQALRALRRREREARTEKAYREAFHDS